MNVPGTRHGPNRVVLAAWMSPRVLALVLEVDPLATGRSCGALVSGHGGASVTLGIRWLMYDNDAAQPGRQSLLATALMPEGVAAADLGGLELRAESETRHLLPKSLRSVLRDSAALAAQLDGLKPDVVERIQTFLAGTVAEHDLAHDHALASALAKVLDALRPAPADTGFEPLAGRLETVYALHERAFWLTGWIHDSFPRAVRLVAVSPEGVRAEAVPGVISFHPRPDAYAPALGSDASALTLGFLAYVELEDPSVGPDGWQLEFHTTAGKVLQDVAREPVERDPEQVWTHVLAQIRAESVDTAVLEHQVLSAIGGLRDHGVRIEQTIAYGAVPVQADVSVVVAVRRFDRLQHQLLEFVRDPEFWAAELTFVAPVQIAHDLPKIAEELHSLYGLPFRLVLLSGPVSRVRALNLAAGIAQGRLLMLTSGDVFPAAPGWLGALRLAQRSMGVGAVGPKLLREDDSIAHAGASFVRRAGDSQWRRKLPFAGLARTITAADGPRAVQALSDQCLMIKADVFAAFGGFSELYFGGDYEGDDLCLRLRDAGRENWYVPTAECYLLDRPDQLQRSSPIGAVFNDWLFNHRNGESLTRTVSLGPTEASVSPTRTLRRGADGYRAVAVSAPRVLYVANNHTSIRPGGVQTYADELYRSMRESGAFEPLYVSRIGSPHSIDAAHEGTRFGLADARDENLYYFHTESGEFDRVMWTAQRKGLYTEDWRDFLRVQRPDVVHFHHALFLGFDMIRETRRTLPKAAIVFTLHDFLAICMHAGQMVRSGTFELCDRSSPRRCNECFPSISTQTFFRRHRFLLATLEFVDLFITPSEFTRRRYIDWGIPADKIRNEDYGRVLTEPVPDPSDAGRRRRIGFFGRMTHFKGVDLLLEAMAILGERGADVQLVMCGANLELMPAAFQDRIRSLLEQTDGLVHFAGPYEQSELPALLSAVDWLVVPSIWWETGPLVIHEALMHRRPVICSDIGSMAERIQDGVNGLHFRVGDPRSLADTINRAVDSPELWDEIRGRITDPHAMDEHLANITGIYSELLSRN